MPHVTSGAAAATVFMMVGCATAGGGTGLEVSQSGGGCPPAEGEIPYTISVSNQSGDTASASVRQAIANALAGAWGHEDDDKPRPPRYYRALRELAQQVPRSKRYGMGKWRARAGDSAVVQLTYRRGSLPELEVPPTIHPELLDRIMRATAAAVASAANGQSVRDTMPLEIPGARHGQVALEVRVGWTPAPGAAVATFALRESEPTIRKGMFALRYPEEYRVRNIEGSVLVAFILTDSGTVDGRSVRAISSDGDLFTTSVRDFLAKARYEPYMLDCVAFPLVTAQPFNFSLTR